MRAVRCIAAARGIRAWLLLSAACSPAACATSARNDCAALRDDVVRIRAAKFATNMDQWHVVVHALECGAHCPDVFRLTLADLMPGDPHEVFGREDDFRPGSRWTHGEMLLALARTGFGKPGSPDDGDGEFTSEERDELDALLASRPLRHSSAHGPAETEPRE